MFVVVSEGEKTKMIFGGIERYHCMIYPFHLFAGFRKLPHGGAEAGRTLLAHIRCQYDGRQCDHQRCDQ